ncbi:Putative proline-rich receptor-like protein kinase PERK11 [Linum perenne]
MKSGGEVIVVAVDAGTAIADEALIWALRNVARNSDSLFLLPLLPSYGSEAASATSTAANRAHQQQQSFPGIVRKWVVKRLYRDESPQLPSLERQPEEVRRVNKICVDMIRLLCRIHKKQLQTQVKVVADAQLGSVASAAKELEATWVILDRQLKKEGEFCMRELKCNIVVMEQSVPKVMRTVVNPNRARRRHSVSGSDGFDPTSRTLWGLMNHTSSNTSTVSEMDSDASTFKVESDEEESFRRKLNETPPGTLFHLDSVLVERRDVAEGSRKSPMKESMPEITSCSDDEDDGDGGGGLSVDSRVVASSSGLCRRNNELPSRLEKDELSNTSKVATLPSRRSLDGHSLSRFRDSFNLPSRNLSRGNSLVSIKTINQFEEETVPHREIRADGPSNIASRTSSIRRAMPLSMKSAPIPPPLCSMCKHKAPVFGKAPKKFTYQEIKSFTDGFSRESIMAEGGRGLVYRGKLPNGQVVAVKQYKSLTSEGASELCSEVEVLSCAQHRNLVMLIGYCVEREWFLVYEFACNGSLDRHLYKPKPSASNHPGSATGNEIHPTGEVMAWEHRMKVAIGAARGLRYLHEDCRVGCIVHRDFRPRNILLTHDFEPMVGDFGLARWQSDGQKAEETRVIGAIGYLAPEYTQAGIITEKADVYAFGVVLLELLCGVKATEFSRSMDQNFLLELGRWLMERDALSEILDQRLQDKYVENEVMCMVFASSLCLSPNPENRPSMSKVLKILEGDIPQQPGFVYPNQLANVIYDSKPPAFSKVFEEQTHVAKPKHEAPQWWRNSSNVEEIIANPPPTKSGGGGDNGGGGGDGRVDFSGEYNEYLQGSLVKFFDGLDKH